MELQCVQLLFEGAVSLDYGAIANTAREILGAAIDAEEFDAGGLLLVHKDFRVQLSDGEIPIQTALFATNEGTSPNSYADEINQSWRCENAAELIRSTRRSVLVTELMASLADPDVRLRLFHGVLEAAIRVAGPVALVFMHSQQVVDPGEYLDSLDAPILERPGSINVRFFKITDRPGEMLMDLLGLDTIGLHDLQCHFRDLSPNDVSRKLYGLANYLFVNGPVIESGHTIEGIAPGAKWKCQFEDSLLSPKRCVLDLNPGRPYAAGDRE